MAFNENRKRGKESELKIKQRRSNRLLAVVVRGSVADRVGDLGEVPAQHHIVKFC